MALQYVDTIQLLETIGRMGTIYAKKHKNKKTMFYFDSTREMKVLISRALSCSYTRTLTARFHTREMGRKKKEKEKK